MVNVYPRQYQLPELTAHLVSLLERRRAGLEAWDERAEAMLTEHARTALAEAAAQFREVTDDAAYWQRTEASLVGVALPRYFKLAKAQHALEQRGYDVWRRGDLISRVTYALIGLVLGVIIARTPIPNWLEPIPLALFIVGPLLPDFQVWLAKRRYDRQLLALVDDMGAEAEERGAYQPVGVGEVTSSAEGERPPDRERTR